MSAGPPGHPPAPGAPARSRRPRPRGDGPPRHGVGPGRPCRAPPRGARALHPAAPRALPSRDGGAVTPPPRPGGPRRGPEARGGGTPRRPRAPGRGRRGAAHAGGATDGSSLASAEVYGTGRRSGPRRPEARPSPGHRVPRARSTRRAVVGHPRRRGRGGLLRPPRCWRPPPSSRRARGTARARKAPRRGPSFAPPSARDNENGRVLGRGGRRSPQNVSVGCTRPDPQTRGCVRPGGNPEPRRPPGRPIPRGASEGKEFPGAPRPPLGMIARSRPGDRPAGQGIEPLAIQGPLRRSASLSHDGRTHRPPYARKSPVRGGPARPAQGARPGRERPRPAGPARGPGRRGERVRSRQGFGPVGALEHATAHVRRRSSAFGPQHARVGAAARPPTRPCGAHGGAPPGAPPRGPRGNGVAPPRAGPRSPESPGDRGRGRDRAPAPPRPRARSGRSPGPRDGGPLGGARPRRGAGGPAGPPAAEGESPVRRDGERCQGPRPLGTVPWTTHVGIDPHPRTQYLPGPIGHSTVRER